MVEWRDQGVLLSSRRHGEGAAIIDVFTSTHGRHCGLVRGGSGRRLSPILQPGAQLDVTWSARLEGHLGSYRVEPMRSRTAIALSGRLALAGLNAVTTMLSFCLPERECYRALYERTEQLLDVLDQEDLWPLAYLFWEMQLLNELGFGLDLSCCAVTGTVDDLAYVSPKTARAVARTAAGEWVDKLLPLPPVMLGRGAGREDEILIALRTTEFFLTHKLAVILGHETLPKQRGRFVDLLARKYA